MAKRIRDGIAAVRGRVYTAQQSSALYPTTATTHDYAYARHFVDTGRRRILGFTLETAREFQPADAEKNNVITEVSAGLMECLLETLCPADTVQALVDALFPLRALRRFRDRYMLNTAAGARYDKMFRAHTLEVGALEETVTVSGASPVVDLQSTQNQFVVAKEMQLLSVANWQTPLAIRFSTAPVREGGHSYQLRRLLRVLSSSSFNMTEEFSVDGGPFRRLGQATFEKVR